MEYGEEINPITLELTSRRIMLTRDHISKIKDAKYINYIPNLLECICISGTDSIIIIDKSNNIQKIRI